MMPLRPIDYHDKGNWEEVYRENPWMAPRILQKRYPGLEKHAIDNFRRTVNADLKERFEKYKLGLRQSKEMTHASLYGAWRYYLTEELELSCRTEKLSEELMRLRDPRRPWSFLIDNRFLSKLDDFEGWEYRNLSFAIINIFPGKEFCEEHGVRAELFSGTRIENPELKDAVKLLEHIYLKLRRGINSSSSQEEIDKAKKDFIDAWRRNSWCDNLRLKQRDLSPFLGKYLREFEKSEIFEKLEHKFRQETDRESPNTSLETFNASKFRGSHPDIPKKCEYCGVEGTQLHHPLEQNRWPHYNYHSENVISLCYQVHVAITHCQKLLTEDSQKKYDEAIKCWLNAPEGQKLRCFDEVINEIHREKGLRATLADFHEKIFRDAPESEKVQSGDGEEQASRLRLAHRELSPSRRA